MKLKYKNTILSAIFACLIVQSGCKKGWLDVNYNPRELTNINATPDLLLAPVLEEAAFIAPDFEYLSMWMGYWAAPTLPPALNFTNYTNIASGSSPGQGVVFLEEKSTSLGQEFYTGIAKTIRALVWSRAVDKVNDVPYTEAYKDNILRPKYDSGQSIYDDLMKQLTLASGLIKNADIVKNQKIAIADIMFHGDKVKWLQFINTLKLRLLIHQANRTDRAAYIANEIQIIKNEGSGFLPSGVNGAVNPGYGANIKVSPYYGLYSSHNTLGGSRGDFSTGVNSVDFAHANEYALNLLKADNDPRIGFIYSTVDLPLPANAPEPFPQPAPLTFRGSRFGLLINTIQYPYQNRQYISAVGGSRNVGVVTTASTGIVKGNNMDNWLITSVESAFLQAEAIYRGWLSGNPEQAYKTAVQESFRWLNIGGNSASPALSDFSFNQWYNSSASQNNQKINWSVATDKYKLIMYQKYMALNGIDAFETWTDYRRNGRFPDVPISVDPTRISNIIPIRFVYTQDEIITNAEQVKALGEINTFTGKIWWMP